MYEAIGYTEQVSDKRLWVEISALRQIVNDSGMIVLWVEGAEQLNNVLTKHGTSPQTTATSPSTRQTPITGKRKKQLLGKELITAMCIMYIVDLNSIKFC